MDLEIEMHDEDQCIYLAPAGRQSEHQKHAQKMALLCG